MNYISTRGLSPEVDSAQAVLTGLAPDGGLYLPKALPDFDAKALMGKTAEEMSAAILSALLPDIPDMPMLVKRGYTGKFTAEGLTPTVKAGENYILELFHGPTSAFKDIALCMLPQLLTAAKTAKGMEKDILILTATSGDTGKAALCGFADVPGIRICVFYPHGGVSQVQQMQMATQEGGNVTVCAVKGNFDDAQTGVKNIFHNFSGEGKSFDLSSANSINMGRLAPQIMYYFKSYSDLMANGTISWGESVNFSVPTGNFGDILAGFLAKKLGLPVGKLICASNANNVLTDFLRTGIYDRRRDLHKTTSPSMDILVSSNLERMLYLATGDTAKVAGWMQDLSDKGFYEVDDDVKQQLAALFWADCASDNEVSATIRGVWQNAKYLCDPHTACGYLAADRYKAASGDNAPMVVLSTASIYKFPTAVLDALGKSVTGDEFARMDALHALSGVPVPKNLATLREKEILHKTVIDKTEMEAFVMGL